METFIRNNLSGIVSRLLEREISFLLKHSSLTFWGNIFLACMVTLAFYPHTVHTEWLLSWASITVLISFSRLYNNQRFNPAMRDCEVQLASWVNHHILFTTLLSLAWGLSGLLLFPEQLIHQVLLIVAISAVLISSITTLAASKNIFYLQVTLLLSPTAIRLAWMDGIDYKILALAIILMGIMAAIVANYVYHVLKEVEELKEIAQNQAHTDQVTQLSNRRHFDKKLKEEWRRAAREKKPLSLLMIDVDHFKLYNDHNGHQAGDRCLKYLANCMKSIARRQGDLVARHGGEEFAILLPNTNLNDSKQIAEKLRQRIIDLGLPHKSPSSLLDVVTVSIGVSHCIPRSQRNRDTGEDVLYPAMLIGAADRAMYQAKKRGRNRVEVESCDSKAETVQLHKAIEAYPS